MNRPLIARLFNCATVLAALTATLHAAAPSAQPRTTADQPPEGVSKSDWASIREAYDAGQHSFKPMATGWEARNAGQQWLTSFDRRGFVAQPQGAAWQWGLELKSYGLDGSERAIGGVPAVKAAGQRLSYQWDASLNEWFVNDRRGLEHGFTVAQRPEGQADAPLAFTLGVRGGLRPAIAADALGVAFQNDSGTTLLNYSGLKVWDADGKVLASRFVAADGGVRLLVVERGARYPITIDPIAQQALITGSNTTPGDNYAFNFSTDYGDAFGRAVAISGDTVVIGAPGEDSNATGVNGNGADNSLRNSGAAYVFVRSGGVWTQQAYLKASNPVGTSGNNEWQGDNFGQAVAIAGDTIVIGAPGENGHGLADATTDTTWSGAAYVFVRSGTNWTQQAYLKAMNPSNSALFGGSVAISGETIVIGSASSLARIVAGEVFNFGNVIGGEGANNTGVNAFTNAGGAPRSGAAYVFVRGGTLWSQQAYLKASNTDANDGFGQSVSISGDTLVVGAWNETSAATGVNGNQADNSSPLAGAAYVFARSGGTWTQQAYLKADSHAYNSALNSQSLGFGYSVSISGDTVVVAAPLAGLLINNNANAYNADKVFVFTRSAAGAWTQQAAIPAPDVNPNYLGAFGLSVAVSGETLVIGDPCSQSSFGRAVVYTRTPAGAWLLQGTLNGPGNLYQAGYGYAVALSGETAVSAAGGASEDQGFDYYIKGNNRAQIFTGVGLPRMSVEQPAGSVIASGGTRTVGTLPGTSTDLLFTVRSIGSALTLTGTPNLVALSGSSDFSILTQPASPVAQGATTTFTVRFAPATAGLKTATLTIPSDDASTPYVINLAGNALSSSTSTTGDGLSDAAKFKLSALGFDWQVSQPALVNTYFANANIAGLYTSNQLQALNVNSPLLAKGTNGQFTLTIGVQKSTNLTSFTAFPLNSAGASTVIDGAGKLQFTFPGSNTAAFFKLQSQ